MEPDPVLRSKRERYVQTCRIKANREMNNFTRRIYFEGTPVEQERMLSFLASPMMLFMH